MFSKKKFPKKNFTKKCFPKKNVPEKIFPNYIHSTGSLGSQVSGAHIQVEMDLISRNSICDLLVHSPKSYDRGFPSVPAKSRHKFFTTKLPIVLFGAIFTSAKQLYNFIQKICDYRKIIKTSTQSMRILTARRPGLALV